MSSDNYQEEVQVKLFFLRWFPTCETCFCLDLKTVALIFAYIDLMLYTLSEVIVIRYFIREDGLFNYAAFVAGSLKFHLFTNFIMAIILLYGLHKENKDCVLAWLLAREILCLQLIGSFLMDVFAGVKYNWLLEIAITGFQVAGVIFVHNYYVDISPTSESSRAVV